MHDLSKYSISEFSEGVKYYSGNYSPIKNCKNDIGYSNAWLHYKGRNKHHYEYWYDYDAKIECPIIPFKYFVEMVCDSVAAGMIYQGKNCNTKYQLDYWNKVRINAHINPIMDDLLIDVYTKLSVSGLKKVINKKKLKILYNKHISTSSYKK